MLHFGLSGPATTRQTRQWQPVPRQDLKPAFGRRHVFASRSTLFFLNRFSRSVIAQGVRGRYSRLVQDDSGKLVS